MTLFSAPEVLPFGIAACGLIVLCLIDGIGAFFTMSPTQLIDDFIPDSPEFLDGALTWLHVGHIPLLALIALFLFGFSISGYAIQIAMNETFGSYLYSWIAVLPAALIGLSAVRTLGSVLTGLLPKQGIVTATERRLVGRAGIVISGTARAGIAAEVRLRDEHGHAYYLMLEPDLPEEKFEAGAEVLIVKKVGAVYRGIRNPHPALL